MYSIHQQIGKMSLLDDLLTFLQQKYMIKIEYNHGRGFLFLSDSLMGMNGVLLKGVGASSEV